MEYKMKIEDVKTAVEIAKTIKENTKKLEAFDFEQFHLFNISLKSKQNSTYGNICLDKDNPTAIAIEALLKDYLNKELKAL